MMRWRIFFWAGLGVLVASWGFCRDTQAGSTYQSPQIHIIPAPSVSQAKSPPSASFRERIYQVKKGDTLAKIAGKTGISIANLREVNRLKGSALKIGQKIELYRSQDNDAVETAELVRNQEKSEREPEEEEDDDGGSIRDGAGNVGERYERENAASLGQWNNPEEQRMLVKVAMGFLGAPYRLGGSSVTGLDCSGFVKKIYQFFNIDLPRTAFAQSLVGLPVKRSELVAGDLLFFNTIQRLGHVGIYIGNNEFVHASSWKRGVRVDNLDMPYFDKRFARAVRLKETDEGSVASRLPAAQFYAEK